jgi:carbamoyl-phosphate synthase large subunit
MVVIEMNPRVSRSSALASKATGFPIAKIAAKLAVGYTLDELTNEITRKTPACFEPTLDYVVVKIPKWQFEKFPGADEGLGPQMKSVGEAMAIGRTFKEALLKAVRSLETGKRLSSEKLEPKILVQRLVTPHPERLAYIRYALREGMTVKELAKMTSIDPWFLYQLKRLMIFGMMWRSIRLMRRKRNFARQNARGFQTSGWREFGELMDARAARRFAIFAKSVE